MIVNLFGIYFHILEIPTLLFLSLMVLVTMARCGTTIKTERPFLVQLLFYLLLLYISAILISSLNALNSNLAIKSAIKWFEIFIIICLCFLYVNSERRLYFLYWVLFGSGFLFIMAVFMRILKGETYLLAFRVFPGYEAVFSFAMVLPFLNRGKNKFIWVLIGICLLSILLSLSRGAWLAWLLCILYGFSFLKEKAKKHMKRSLLIIVVFFLAISTARELLFAKWGTVFSSADASNVERLSLIRIAFAAFLERPVFGIGSLNFPEFMIQRGLTEGITAKNIFILEPHNTFLQIAAEEGILGLLCFLSLVCSTYYLLFKGPKSVGFDIKYLYGLRGFFIAMCVNFLFGYIASQFRFLLALLIGLSLALTRIQSNRHA